jgi:oligopeptide transport system ATP-binding protein
VSETDVSTRPAARASQTTLLKARNLVKRFPVRGERAKWVHAVNDVSFEIKKGEAFALIGESGSGKTTIGRCILRTVKPTSGSIIFGNTDLTTLSDKEMRPWRAHLQAVFQDPSDSFNPRWTVARSIDEVLRNCTSMEQAERRERIEEVISLVHLEPSVADARPGRLSSGVQQRAAIARALAPRPDLIVLDEPTSHLDVVLRADIVRLLKELQASLGTAYLFISHDLASVREISDRVGIMYLGEMVETASGEDLFERQLHPYGKALLASVLTPDPDVELSDLTLSDEIPSPVDLPSGCFLHPRCPYADHGRCATTHPPLEAYQGREVRCIRVAEIEDD